MAISRNYGAPIAISTSESIAVRYRPIIRYAGLGIAEDFENRASVGIGDMRELWTLILATQYIEEPPVDAITRSRRHRVENLAVDHVGERIAEQPALQVEIP